MKTFLIAGLVVLSAMVVFTGTAAADDWVNPTGYNDPGNHWSNEENAYDDDLGTLAEWNEFGYNIPWGGFLELTTDSISCDKIRFYVGWVNRPDISDQIDVDVYKDGSWIDVYQGSFTIDEWIEKSFAQGIVTEARFRFGQPNTAMGGKARLTEFDFWKLEMSGPATVESADDSGATKDIFQLGDSVYAIGSGYATGTTYDLHIVADTTWTDGMAIPSRVIGTATSVTTDASGNIPAGTQIWASSVVGKYDIVVDVNGNGQYDANTDALDSNIDVGFETIPEFSTIAIPVATILGLLFLFSRKRKKET